MKSIGETIKLGRKKEKMTQTILAERVGISSKYLSDIETSRKIPSNELLKKLSKILKIKIEKEKKDYSKKQNEILKDIETKKNILEELEQKIKIKKFQYEKLERTSGARSKVTWLCIDTQKKLAENVVEIMSVYDLSTPEQQYSMFPAIKQLATHIEKINCQLQKSLKEDKEIVEVREVNQSAFEKYNVPIPKRSILAFEEEDMIKIITFKVGTIVPRILSDLDKFINKKRDLNGRKTSLIFNGKNDKRSNYYMTNYVSKYVDFFEGMELNIMTTLQDMMEEIITDMSNYDKNTDRKRRFFNTLESVPGHTFLVAIGIISIGEYLIKKQGYIQNGRYLEQVLKARKELANKVKTIFKAMNKGEYTYEEATEIFKMMIAQKIQEQVKIDAELYDQIKFENDLYNLCDEESISDLFYEIIENARKNVTGQMRIFDLKEI